MGLQACGLKTDRTRRELKPHGTPDFPCAGYAKLYTDKPEDVIPWHWHDELEILYVASGSLTVRIPAAEFALSAGDCLAINAGVPHHAAAAPQCELESFVFSPLLLTGSGDSVFAKKYVLPLIACPAFRACPVGGTEGGGAVSDFTAAFEALRKDAPGFEFTVRERLSSFCLALYGRFHNAFAPGEAPPNRDDLRIRKMLDFIEENYDRALDLSGVAKAAEVCERECLRCFQRTIRLSPMQYLLKYRVERGAEALLERPSHSVSEIALSCGFESASNFSKMFKRFFGCTPREYRKARLI